MSVVFIISAPSGSGKSTLVNRLMQEVPNLCFSISYTTRAPRGHEVNGTSYHFTSRQEFETRLEKGEFLEHADVFGNYYGTHRSELESARSHAKDLVLDIDVQGAAQLKESIPDAVTIFILAPSRETLEYRLRSRGEDSDAVIARRLADAAQEIRNYGFYDYVLINEDLDESARTLASIVRAERARRTRIEDKIRPILKTFEETQPIEN
jgi:guanylate kinase